MRLNPRLRGTAILIIQPLCLNLVSLPVMAFVVRTLGPLEFGYWSTAMALTAALAFLRTLGIRSAFVRELSANPNVKETAFAEQMGIRMFLGLLATTLSVSAAAALRYPAAVIWCTLLAGVLYQVSQVTGAVADMFQAHDRLPSLAGINVVAGLTNSALSVLFVFLGGGAIGLSAAYLLAAGLGAILAVFKMSREYCRPRIVFGFGRFRVLLHESRMLTIHTGIGGISEQSQALILPKLTGIESFAAYAAGIIPTTRLAVVTDAICSMAFPRLSRHLEPSRERTGELAYYLVLALGLTVPAAVLLWLVAPILAEVLFPGDSYLCRAVLQVTAWGLPIQSMSSLFSYSLVAARREKLDMQLGLIAHIGGLLLVVVLIFGFGVLGACWGLVARDTVGVALRVPLVRRTYPGLRSGLLALVRRILRRVRGDRAL